MIEQVIFDADLTLIDSFKGVHQIYCLVADALGYQQPSQEDLRRQWGKKIPGIIAGLFGLTEGSDDVDRVLKVTWEKAEGFMHPLFPGTSEALGELKKTGLSLGILSTSYKELFIPHLVSGGVFDLFDLVVGGEDTPETKPYPSVFETFLEKREAENLVYVGDALVDWEAARDAGLGFFLAVTTGHTSKDEFLAAGVPEDQILDSVATVPKALGVKGGFSLLTECENKYLMVSGGE